MKTLISILLLIAITARPAFHMGYFGYYKLNIDEIIGKYCVNKERPQLQCNGKCHLMKTLAITQASEDTEQPISINIAEAFTFVFYQDISINWRFLSKEIIYYEYTYEKAEYQQPLLHIALPPPRV